MMKALNEELIVINGNWKEEIEKMWGETIGFDTNNDNFLDTIWEMSLTAFDIPREVQVVIDNNNNLYISVGNPGFVWFQTPPLGLKLPLKCWIHTHPFGKAYFSGTDWKTIRTWEPVLDEAIVLGGSEWMTWFKGDDYTCFYQKVEIPDFDNYQTSIKDWNGEEE